MSNHKEITPSKPVNVRELNEAELNSVTAGRMPGGPQTPEQCKEIAGNPLTWGF